LVIMAKGKIHADGMPATVLTAQNLSKVYGIKAQIRYLDGQPIILAES
jgi:ABC-type cobalamin/Fe3+-siderophores transport system ATPase subunit